MPKIANRNLRSCRPLSFSLKSSRLQNSREYQKLARSSTGKFVRACPAQRQSEARHYVAPDWADSAQARRWRVPGQARLFDAANRITLWVESFYSYAHYLYFLFFSTGSLRCSNCPFAAADGIQAAQKIHGKVSFLPPGPADGTPPKPTAEDGCATCSCVQRRLLRPSFPSFASV
jgi:hypothetical protein